MSEVPVLGAVIAHYEVLDKLGDGGMGVVYKARDTHLGRLVAIKLLPTDRGPDKQRKLRFTQEARAASALNHPNIITVHDAGEANGWVYIAMEYVRGRTLANLIPRNGLPVAEALRCAVQIADALSSAHDAGIVHRDVKPGNVMVTDKGLIKVLDFGLAKLTEVSDPGPNESTATEKATTEPGMVMGTAAYMAPEQAEGRPVDARADVFSFGALLYEMLCGRPAFQKDSLASTIAAVLTQEPDPMPPVIGRDLRKIVARCLRKDRGRRFQVMADVKVELEDLREELESPELTSSQSPRPARSWRATLAGAVALAVLGGGLYVWRATHVSAEIEPVALTSYAGTESEPTFSPDGRKVAFVWTGINDDSRSIYVQQIGSTGPPMRITGGAAPESYPAWSPDDRWIAFQRQTPDGAAVMVVPSLGGPERSLYVRKRGAAGLSWTPDAKWLVYGERESASDVSSLWAISIDTGERRRLTNPRLATTRALDTGVGDEFPSVSPDGRMVAFGRQLATYVVELWVQRLDRNMRTEGDASRVVDRRYPMFGGIAWTGGSREVVYAAKSLWRVAIDSNRPPGLVSFAQAIVLWPAVSVSTRRLVYAWALRNMNVWRMDTRTGETRMLLASTFDSRRARYSPDGSRIAFQSTRSGSSEVWVCKADGADCVQLTSFGGPQCGSPAWSPDGRWLALDSRVEGQTEIYVMPSDGGVLRRLTEDPADDNQPAWSHDGRWLYYTSDRSGRPEVWRMPAAGGLPVQVTRAGAHRGFESPDGKYLYYTKNAGGPLFRVAVSEGSEEQTFPAVAEEGCGLTSEGVYCLNQDRKRIEHLSLATGRTNTVAVLDKAATNLAVSPDARYLVWDQLDKEIHDLVLVENFR